MSKVSMNIDGVNVSVPRGGTILDAANIAGIRIPTLCHLKDRSTAANCRICVVEVKGQRTLQPACATQVTEAMGVTTRSEVIDSARKTNLELILSSHSWDCHHCLRIGNYGVEELDKDLCSFCFFCDCVRDGDCELQALAEEYKVTQLPFPWAGEPYPIDDSTGAIVRNPNKCIKCRRCIEVCTAEQTVGALGLEERGARLQVAPVLGKSLAGSPCVKCGKCIDVCPTGAIYAKEQSDEVLYTAHIESDVRTVAQISPDVGPELARILKVPACDIELERLAGGLRRMGVGTVVNEDWAEAAAGAEAAEKLSAALPGAAGTLVLSNSSPAIEFLRNEFSSLEGALLTYPSAGQQFGRYVKGVWAKDGIDPAKIRTVTLSADASAKAEARQRDMQTENGPNVDYVLTPREIARMLNKTAVDVLTMAPAQWDTLAGEMPAPNGAYAPLLEAGPGAEGVRELELTVDGKPVKAAVARGLGHVRRLLEEAREGTSPYEVIRICS